MMAEDEKKERKVLIVTSVGTKREPSAGNPVITFGAHDEGDDSAKKGYETWGNDLVNHVVEGARLDCEITHKQKGDQLTLRITQMFDDKGNPIRQTQRRSGGSGSYGKSDDQVRIERISIEGQTSYNGIIELLKAKIIDLDHTQAKTSLEYAEKKMRASLMAEPTPKREEKEAAPRAKAPPVEEKEATTKPPPQPEAKSGAKISDAMIEQLKKAASEKGYKKVTISPLVKFFGVQQAKDLMESQGKELLEKIKKGEGLPKEEPSLL